MIACNCHGRFSCRTVLLFHPTPCTGEKKSSRALEPCGVLRCKECVSTGEVTWWMGSGSSSPRSSYRVENHISQEGLCEEVKSYCDSFPVQFHAKKMQVLNK